MGFVLNHEVWGWVKGEEEAIKGCLRESTLTEGATEASDIPRLWSKGPSAEKVREL